jgi:hypothetical protein
VPVAGHVLRRPPAGFRDQGSTDLFRLPGQYSKSTAWVTDGYRTFR